MHDLGDGAHADAADADDMHEAGLLRIGHVHDERYSLDFTSSSTRSASRFTASTVAMAMRLFRGVRQTLRRGQQALQHPGQALGGKLRLAHAPAAANLLQPCCIFKLIVVKGVGQRHEQAGPADGGQLGHGRGAGAGDDELRRGDPLGQIAEEGREMRGDLGVGISLAKRRQILLAGLLHDVSRPRISSGRRSSAGGNASEKKRAPWLPPNTSSSRRDEASGAV